jgi:hypothetical protein
MNGETKTAAGGAAPADRPCRIAVPRCNRQLMMALPNDLLPIAKIVNAKAISLEDAAKGYAEFDKGVAAKFVLDRAACWRRRPDCPRSGVRDLDDKESGPKGSAQAPTPPIHFEFTR